MIPLDVQQLAYAYGRKSDALHDVSLQVPAGAIYGLIGPNGAGKSTLLQCCAGLRYAKRGTVSVFGRDARQHNPIATGALGYLTEAVRLPPAMTLAQLERYIAPLHQRWDGGLANALREQFALDPNAKLGQLSKGEHMKAALLCALAPRPRLLLMDEPFTGMDVMVKDDLVRGLLASSTDTGTTIVVASHDLTELESVIDHAGILSNGRMLVSASMDALHDRFRRVTVVGPTEILTAAGRDDTWLGVEQAGRRLSFLSDASSSPFASDALTSRFTGAERIEFTEPSLRELLSTLAGPAGRNADVRVTA